MTLNFDGLYSSTRDYAVVDRRPADVAAVTAVFDADFDRRGIRPSAGTGDLVWSPGASGAVLQPIRSARRSIDVENEEMRYAPATRVLCAAARHGVRVQVVMTAALDSLGALSQLRRCGAGIRLYHGEGYYIHAKLLLVDGRSALVGSQNLSAGSLDDNRELGIMVNDIRVLRQLEADFSRDYRNGG